MTVVDMEPTEFQRKYHSKLQIEVDRKVRANVLNGIELLKREYGEDWVDKIDLDCLHLSSSSSCVLGQLYGDYVVGKRKIGLSESEATESGFNLAPGTPGFSVLDAAWIREIGYIRGLIDE